MPIKVDSIRTKIVHVKMDKVMHANFKAQLVHHGLSMQEALMEFARLVGSGNLTANNLLEKLLREQARQELASVGVAQSPRRKPRRLSELDPERLYDLINEVDSNETSTDGDEDETA
jgi:hypothetical protein